MPGRRQQTNAQLQAAGAQRLTRGSNCIGLHCNGGDLKTMHNIRRSKGGPPLPVESGLPTHTIV